MYGCFNDFNSPLTVPRCSRNKWTWTKVGIQYLFLIWKLVNKKNYLLCLYYISFECIKKTNWYFFFSHLQTGKHKVLTKGVRDAARPEVPKLSPRPHLSPRVIFVSPRRHFEKQGYKPKIDFFEKQSYKPKIDFFEK